MVTQLLYSIYMNLFKNFFSFELYKSGSDVADQYLKTIRLNGQGQLPAQYQSLLSEFLIRTDKPEKFLQQLIRRLPLQKQKGHIIKLLTIIHFYVVQRQYSRSDITELQEIDLSFITNATTSTDEKWFKDFCTSYLTYLIKLQSIADIYQSSLKKDQKTPHTLHLTQIFRITNTIRVLFPAFTSAVNVVGRYQTVKYPEMKELYRILSEELVNIYAHVKYLVEQILKQYRVYNPTDLRCFLKSLPQLELTCDKVEDLLVNKYIKGKKLSAKIEFREEKVVELMYYLDYEYEGIKHEERKV